MRCMIGMVPRSLFALPMLATAIALAPSAQAATLSFSGTGTLLGNFSAGPNTTATDTNTNTTAIAVLGSVTANANANALFIQQPLALPLPLPLPLPANLPANLPQPPLALGLSDGIAQGTGTNYVGTANSLSSVVGTFLVGTQSTFSFNFASLMVLGAAADDTSFESATASSNVLFSLYNDQTGSLLDSFGFGGQQVAGGQANFAVADNAFVQGQFFQQDFSYDSQPVTLGALFGSYSRWFDAPTALRLEAVQTNAVQVRACVK